jgi:hypothetical protein
VPLAGSALIKSISLKGGVGDKATISVQLAGQGELNISQVNTIE